MRYNPWPITKKVCKCNSTSTIDPSKHLSKIVLETKSDICLSILDVSICNSTYHKSSYNTIPILCRWETLDSFMQHDVQELCRVVSLKYINHKLVKY